MKMQFSYKTPFGDHLLTVTGKSAARGLDSLRNARKALTKANDLISILRADIRERHACTVRLRKRKDAEIERLRAEIERLKEDRREWRDIAERCFAAAMKNAVKLYDATHNAKINAVALADERKGERGA